jgi:hypothetical protein
VVAAVALAVVVVLLELPHPATASAARGAANMAFPTFSLMLTGLVLSVRRVMNCV